MPLRVLIVDDDAMSREVLSVLLEGEGYAVECADSGEAALALLGGGGNAPEIMLADVQMPGITGAQLAKELRNVCGSATLLLAMSGSRPPDQALALFDGFLMKPFKMEELQAAVAANHHPKAGVRAGRSASGKPEEVATRLSEAGANRSRSRVELDENVYGKFAASLPAPRMREMYAMCVNDVRRRIAAMRGFVEAGDGKQFVGQAHAIKGGCGMLGATELYAMAQELETGSLQAAGCEGAQKVNLLDEMAAACDRLERILESRA